MRPIIGVAGVIWMVLQEIGVERNDNVGLIEMKDRPHRLAKRQLGAFTLVIAG